MTVLVYGKNGSGKSRWAEDLAVSLSKGGLVYIATLMPYGPEDVVRIERHRRQREGMGFRTIEKPFDVSDILLEKANTVLLEDAVNLLGNTIFLNKAPSALAAALQDITALCGMAGNCVLVSISGLEPGPGNDRKTLEYLRDIERMNLELEAFSDCVIEMDGGRPFIQKGDFHALD